MNECPVCGVNLDRVIHDVTRKSDRSRFECPSCGSDLIATVVQTVVVTREIK